MDAGFQDVLDDLGVLFGEPSVECWDSLLLVMMMLLASDDYDE